MATEFEKFEIIKSDDGKFTVEIDGTAVGFAKLYHYASTRGGTSYWKNNVNKRKRFGNGKSALADVIATWMNANGYTPQEIEKATRLK